MHFILPNLKNIKVLLSDFLCQVYVLLQAVNF